MNNKSLVMLRMIKPWDGMRAYWIGYIDLETGHFDGILKRNFERGKFHKDEMNVPMYWWQQHYKIVRRYYKPNEELARHFTELL